AACTMADAKDFKHVTTPAQLEDAIKKNQLAITSDPTVITGCPSVDCVVEATGEIEFAAQVCMKALASKKHVVVLNAELAATLGPIRNVKAKEPGVCYPQAEGDQPAVIMNLYRYAKSIGFTPVMAGNIKSLQDHRRTPTTQAEFARNVWQRPKF